MIRSILGSLVAASILAFYKVHAGQVTQVVDATNFCTFLPPSDSTDRLISDTEWNGAVFCTGSTPKATSSGALASGFIRSAHFVATDDYIQVTGQINPSKENLNISDWGGQYDIKAPDGASCAGYKFFVNLVEPASYTYCIRCCNIVTNCNRGISEKGCAHIIPGDYSGPMDTSITGPATTSSTTTTSSDVVSASSKSSTKSSLSSSVATTTVKVAAARSSTTATPTHFTTSGFHNTIASGNSALTFSAIHSGSSPPGAVISSPALSASDNISAQSVNAESAAPAIYPANAVMLLTFVILFMVIVI